MNDIEIARLKKNKYYTTGIDTKYDSMSMRENVHISEIIDENLCNGLQIASCYGEWFEYMLFQVKERNCDEDILAAFQEQEVYTHLKGLYILLKHLSTTIQFDYIALNRDITWEVSVIVGSVGPGDRFDANITTVIVFNDMKNKFTPFSLTTRTGPFTTDIEGEKIFNGVNKITSKVKDPAISDTYLTSIIDSFHRMIAATGIKTVHKNDEERFYMHHTFPINDDANCRYAIMASVNHYDIVTE